MGIGQSGSLEELGLSVRQSCGESRDSATIWWYSGTISMPMECRPVRLATMLVVPEPVKGSSTVSPSLVKSLMNHSGRASGKAALWFLLLHSVARWSTLDG